LKQGKETERVDLGTAEPKRGDDSANPGIGLRQAAQASNPR
jgi:hypothetical protein